MNTMNCQESEGRHPEGELWEWEACAVCGGSVEPGHGAARINHHGSTVNVCSPLCLESFGKEPDPYLARLGKTMWRRELEKCSHARCEGDIDGQTIGAGACPHVISETVPRSKLALRFAEAKRA